MLQLIADIAPLISGLVAGAALGHSVWARRQITELTITQKHQSSIITEYALTMKTLGQEISDIVTIDTIEFLIDDSATELRDEIDRIDRSLDQLEMELDGR